MKAWLQVLLLAAIAAVPPSIAAPASPSPAARALAWSATDDGLDVAMTAAGSAMVVLVRVV